MSELTVKALSLLAEVLGVWGNWRENEAPQTWAEGEVSVVGLLMTTQKSYFLPGLLWVPNKYVGSMNTLFSVEVLTWKIDFILVFITDTWKWSKRMKSIVCPEGSTELAETNFFWVVTKHLQFFTYRFDSSRRSPPPQSWVCALPIAERQQTLPS